METSQKLDPEFKSKWVAALRSGEYKQGTGTLYRDGLFCCLGVACVVASGKLPVGGYFFIPDSPVPHPNFVHAHEVPELLRGGERLPGLLSKMNDGAVEFKGNPKSFSEIADWIEENL